MEYPTLSGPFVPRYSAPLQSGCPSFPPITAVEKGDDATHSSKIECSISGCSLTIQSTLIMRDGIHEVGEIHAVGPNGEAYAIREAVSIRAIGEEVSLNATVSYTISPHYELVTNYSGLASGIQWLDTVPQFVGGMLKDTLEGVVACYYPYESNRPWNVRCPPLPSSCCLELSADPLFRNSLIPRTSTTCKRRTPQAST